MLVHKMFLLRPSLFRLSQNVLKHKTVGRCFISDIPKGDEFPNRNSEWQTYDPRGILQEEEDERKHFADLIEELGEHRFVIKYEDMQKRSFIASQDPEEWKYIERLMPQEVVPSIPKKEEYPSGFAPPTSKIGELPYYVGRTSNHMLPVYVDYRPRQNLVITQIKKVDGNMFQLRKELDEFLLERYHMEFISQVAEVFGKIVYRGDFEDDFKEFLLSKGF